MTRVLDSITQVVTVREVNIPAAVGYKRAPEMQNPDGVCILNHVGSLPNKGGQDAQSLAVDSGALFCV